MILNNIKSNIFKIKSCFFEIVEGAQPLKSDLCVNISLRLLVVGLQPIKNKIHK
jgi:hypothetical protein